MIHHLTIRKRLKYVILVVSFVAALCALAGAWYENWHLSVASGLFWLVAVCIDYYSTTVHGIGETKRERMRELKAAQ